MPAKSEKQRILLAIAANSPEKLFARNRGLLQMSKLKLSDFASKPLSQAIQARKVKK